MPFSAPNVMRFIGARHPEQAAEMDRLADQFEMASRPPITREKLREMNGAYARGIYWCKKFEADLNPLMMP